MAWVDAGTRAGLYEGSSLRGYCHFEYDNSTGTTSRNCRLRIESISGTSFTVNFNNITINGSNKGSVSNVTQNYTGADSQHPSIWTGTVSAGSVTVKWTNPWFAGSKTPEITGTIPSGGGYPTGGNGKYNSSSWSWNSSLNKYVCAINTTASVSSWGSGYSGSPEMAQCVCISTATNANWLSQPRQVKWTQTYNTSVTGDVTYYNSQQWDGGLNIKGCMPFKVAGFGQTFDSNHDAHTTWTLLGTVYYTPPAPLVSITRNESRGSTGVSVTATITGNSSTYNENKTVTTQYCYSVNGGSTFTSWADAGTGSPWTAKTTSAFTVPYNTSIVIRARQKYQPNSSTTVYSSVKELSFTSLDGTAPSSLTATITGSGWDNNTGVYATVKGTVGSYGNPSGAANRYFTIGLNINGSSLSNRRQASSAATATNWSTNINNSSSNQGGTFTLKGLMAVYPFIWATNTVKSATTFGSVYYLPPAPLASITKSETQNSTDVTITATITGGDSSVNENRTVTTQYCYSVNGGSYSAWASAGTGSPWTAKTVTFNVSYGASVSIKARQKYNDLYSSEKTLSFTATNGTAPSGGTVTVTGSTWNSVTLQASGIDYGKPDGISSRGSIVGVTPEASSYSYKREVGLGAVTSGTGTVNNSSASGGSAQPFDLKGMLPIYAYLWVNNTVQSAFVEHKSTPYYLPPAPGQLTYTLDSETPTTKTYTVTYVGVAANNVTDYTAADLKRTFRYSTDGGSTWTYVDNDATKALTTASSFTITLNAQNTVQIEAYLSYKGTNSDTSSLSITNSSSPVCFYGSVNGETAQVIKLYGSANGETVKIKKLYASVNGVSRLVYDDPS